MGYSRSDLAMFYFVRQVPQFKRDGSLKKKNLSEIYPQYMRDTYHAMNIKKNIPTYTSFLDWYRSHQGKTFALNTFDNEETSPQEKGEFYTQRIGHAVGMVRDRYVVKLIADLLEKNKKVMIVFGKSHLAQQRRALVDMLGKPTSESN